MKVVIKNESGVSVSLENAKLEDETLVILVREVLAKTDITTNAAAEPVEATTSKQKNEVNEPKIDAEELATKLNEHFKNRGAELDEHIDREVHKSADEVINKSERPNWGDQVLVGVNCSICGHTDQITTSYGNRYITCPNCREHLFLNSAVPGQFGVANTAGEYYVAREPYYDREAE